MFTIASIVSAFPAVKLFGVNISISDLLYLISFYFIVMMNLANKKNPIVLTSMRYKSIWFILFFIGIGTFLGLIRTTSISDSLSYFIQYIFIFVVLLTVVIYLIDARIKNAIKLFAIWLIPHGINVVIILLSKLGLYNNFDHLIIGGNGRYIGFYGIATSLGLTMTFVLFGMLFYFQYSKRQIKKIIFFMLALASLYALLLSGSFGALALFAVSVVLYVLLILRKAWFIKTVLILLTISAGLWYLFLDTGISSNNVLKYAPSVFMERLEKSDGQIGSSNLRMELNMQAIDYFVKNPLVGVGADQFNQYNNEGRNVHNTIISAAVETGIFGLVGTLIYLLLPILYSWRLTRTGSFGTESKEHLFINYLFVFSVLRLVQTLFSGPYIQRESWIPYLIIISVYCTLYVNKKKNTVGIKLISKQISNTPLYDK